MTAKEGERERKTHESGGKKGRTLAFQGSTLKRRKIAEIAFGTTGQP